MILAIDAGNTQIVLGCFSEKGELSPTFRIPTLTYETEFGYASKIKEVLQIGNIKTEQLKGAIICSTVPQINKHLKLAVKLLKDVPVLVVGNGAITNLETTAPDQSHIGPDLIAAAVAAKSDYPLPAIIVDLGTATTVTVVDENKKFIGGAILPGVRISQDALASRTSLLPHINLQKPRQAISIDTIQSIQSGAIYGTAGSIDGIIDKFSEEMNVKPQSIIATGGLCDEIIPHCRHDIILDKELLLRGLIYIWNINKTSN